MNKSNEFTVTFTDLRGRDYRATYARKARGLFPKLIRLERYQDNGRDWFWTLYRPACHGDLEANTKALLKQHAELVRYQA